MGTCTDAIGHASSPACLAHAITFRDSNCEHSLATHQLAYTDAMCSLHDGHWIDSVCHGEAWPDCKPEARSYRTQNGVGQCVRQPPTCHNASNSTVQDGMNVINAINLPAAQMGAQERSVAAEMRAAAASAPQYAPAPDDTEVEVEVETAPHVDAKGVDAKGVSLHTHIGWIVLGVVLLCVAFILLARMVLSKRKGGAAVTRRR